MSAKNCHICGKEVDVHKGGCVLAFTFCRFNSVNIINLSYCLDCYDKLVDNDLRMLNADANLKIIFDEE